MTQQCQRVSRSVREWLRQGVNQGVLNDLNASKGHAITRIDRALKQNLNRKGVVNIAANLEQTLGWSASRARACSPGGADAAAEWAEQQPDEQCHFTYEQARAEGLRCVP